MRRASFFGSSLLAFAALAGCGDDTGETSSSSSTSGPGSGGGGASSTSSGPGTGGGGTGGAGGGAACERPPAPADAARSVVVSHPYADGGGGADAWELLALSASGELSRPGTTFSMGRSTGGRVHFTPDGELGFVAQEDGTLGVFRISGGQVEVLHEAYDGSFYAHDVMIAPEGDHLIVLDVNFPNNGGGLYRVDIGCDGALVDRGLVTPSRLAYAGVWLDGDVVLAVRDVLGAPGAHQVARLAWPTPSLLSSSVAFPDDEAIVAGFARTRDGAFLLVGDNSGFASVPNRVAVVKTAGGLGAVQVLPDLEDPYAIATSPTNDAAIVVSGFGDAIVVLDYDPTDAASPFTLRGELAYTGAGPQLPGALATVDRGSLDGLVLVSELSGVRRVRFGANGAVTDLGLFDLGDGMENVVGAVGVAP
jgi:hypothetical protein